MSNASSGFGKDSGASLGDSMGNAIGSGTDRGPVANWKFGLRLSDDRQGM